MSFIPGKILKQSMEDLVEFFQSGLQKDFGFSDDHVVDVLQGTIDELKRLKLQLPAPGETNELPTKPFGLFVPPSMEQMIMRRPVEPESELLQGKRGSILEVRPSIPADGGPALVPFSHRLSHLSSGQESPTFDEEYETATDGFSSRASIPDYRSSRTSFVTMDTSDVASTTPTMSRPTQFYSSFHTLNDMDLSSFPRSMDFADISHDREPIRKRNSLSSSQVSDYDNVNNASPYEQDLERTLESMDIDGNATFTRGMSLRDYYNGWDEPATPRLDSYLREPFHSHDISSNQRQGHLHYEYQETREFTRKVNNSSGVPQNGAVEQRTEIRQYKSSTPARVMPSPVGRRYDVAAVSGVNGFSSEKKAKYSNEKPGKGRSRSHSRSRSSPVKSPTSPKNKNGVNGPTIYL